ncbi:HNH endonuclease (plasmid) [Roseomonas marmotae]|uniref:HNH endonuclease signature motif containing protein n=1 Tax=Roseomonas marmotae TaxID=2768161 RepID=UPI001AD6A7EE|nr:HNH endonuclease signature motif containing protein [Roseomonas marmotae]QTI82150.1 HNH endonuclease [Roseomonas marmotae]
MGNPARRRAPLKMATQLLPAADLRTARPPPKQASDHYGTPEHRAWAAAVLGRAGSRCQGPGCGRTGTRLYADHIVELQDGGAPLALANGQALCGACHSAKTARVRAERQRTPPPPQRRP